jgi:hypothetical protein
MDTMWKVKKIEEKIKGRLIRYADDFVVLCKGDTNRILEGVKRTINHLGLSLNEAKTRIVEAGDGFNFLGFNIKVVENPKTGKSFPLTRPSKKSIKHIRAEIKAKTCRTQLALPEEMVIKRVSETVKGWVGYFHFKNCTRDLSQLDEYLKERVRIYLRKKHQRKGRYKAYPNSYLYETLGLYKIPTTAPWTQTVKAVGRR